MNISYLTIIITLALFAAPKTAQAEPIFGVATGYSTGTLYRKVPEKFTTFTTAGYAGYAFHGLNLHGFFQHADLSYKVGDNSVDLTGCLSAYTATVTQANLDGVEVYKDDRSCLAKLTTFTIGGITYNTTNPGASNFATWLANDTALFASAGLDIIRVQVISQLDSPISGTEAIVYNFSELLDGQGDYTFLEADVSDAHAITIASQEAPLFKVASAQFTGMDDATGAPEFIFKMECVDNPTLVAPTSVAMGAGSAANTLCGTNDLQNVTYKLVRDTFGSDLTITEAETIFSTAGTSITLPADQYQDSATNEGFNTTTLDGPGGLGVAGNENMILILKAGLSFTYFNIDVTTITQ